MAEQPAAIPRHDLEVKIVKKCWEDEKFREEFTADPATAFIKYLQVPAAGLPRIFVHQEDAGSWHIVIPVKPANTGELSEEDLERVAGGVTPVVSVVSTIVSTVVASSASVTFVSYTVSRDVGGW
jgi:hypothetical protein